MTLTEAEWLLMFTRFALHFKFVYIISDTQHMLTKDELNSTSYDQINAYRQ